MEGEALDEAVLCPGLVFRDRLVELGQAANDRDGLVAPHIVVGHLLEEASPQHLRHVFFAHGLDAFLALPPEDREQVALEKAAHVALFLRRVGGEKRRHDRRPVHLGDGLVQVLEEVADAVAPDRIQPSLLASVHQHFVHQNQRAHAVAAGNFEQLGEERLGRRRLSFFVLVVRVDGAQSVGACKLKSQHAPRMLEGAPLAVRCAHVFDALLGVDLVEAQRGDERLRQVLAHVLAERRHRRRVRQRTGVAEEVVQRDQRVGLAAAVGEFQLPDRPVGLAGEAKCHVLDQLAERRRREGEVEELGRVLVDGTLSPRQRDLVKIGGELGQRELAAAEFVLEADEGGPGLGLHGCVSGLGNQRRSVARSSWKAGSRHSPTSATAAMSSNMRAFRRSGRPEGARRMASVIAFFGVGGLAWPSGHNPFAAKQARIS